MIHEGTSRNERKRVVVTRAIFSRVPPNRMIRGARGTVMIGRVFSFLSLYIPVGKGEEGKRRRLSARGKESRLMDARSRVYRFSRENAIIDRGPRSIRKDEKCGFCRRKRSIKLYFNDARILRMPWIQPRNVSVGRTSSGRVSEAFDQTC